MAAYSTKMPDKLTDDPTIDDGPVVEQIEADEDHPLAGDSDSYGFGVKGKLGEGKGLNVATEGVIDSVVSLRSDSGDLEENRTRFGTHEIVDLIKGGMHQRTHQKPLAESLDDLFGSKLRTGPSRNFIPKPTLLERLVSTRALVLALLAGTVLAGGAYHYRNQASASTSKPLVSIAPPAAPIAAAVTQNLNPVPPAAEKVEEAKTLYAAVEAEVSKQVKEPLESKAQIRLKAASTHQLMKDHFSSVRRWEDLDGRWKDDARAFDLAIHNLDNWGYDEALDTLPASVTTIDGMLSFIATDHHFNHSEAVAANIAIEIAMMDDARISADPSRVRADLAAIAPQKIKSTVEHFVEHPSPIPPVYTSPTPATPTASSHDAPEPPMHLLRQVQVQASTPMLDAYEAPEPPMHLRPATEYKEESMPVLLTAAQMGIASDLDVPEARTILSQAQLSTKPAPSLVQKATATVKGWASKIGKWFS